MRIEGTVALVTGAGRGLGREFVRQLHERGASKIYATSRTRPVFDLPGVETLALDVTDAAAAARAAAVAGDVQLLVNNAGISTLTSLLTGDIDEIRREVDTHFWGTLSMVRAFAPVLAGNGGGAVLNMLSALSWHTFEGAGAYAAAKAAAWSLTDSIRLELAPRGIQVTGLFAGAIDTDMMAGFDVPKADAAEVVRAALDGVAGGAFEVIIDDAAATAKRLLAADPRERFPQLAGAAAVTYARTGTA